MPGEQKKVAIDTDFFIKLTENNPDGKLFLDIMDELEVYPVMHRYVYEYELAGNSTVIDLVKRKKIQVIDYDEYLSQDREVYEQFFRAAFQSFNCEHFKDKNDIYKYCHAKQSLGEIRTALMAFYMGIELLLSDDGEAKTYITNRISNRRHPIKVYNIYDTLMAVGEIEGRNLKWSAVKGVAKRIFSHDRSLYEEINRVWHERE